MFQHVQAIEKTLEKSTIKQENDKNHVDTNTEAHKVSCWHLPHHRLKQTTLLGYKVTKELFDFFTIHFIWLYNIFILQNKKEYTSYNLNKWSYGRKFVN